jgi:hypothetical protein
MDRSFYKNGGVLELNEYREATWKFSAPILLWRPFQSDSLNRTGSLREDSVGVGPISRIVPTTITKITARMTAYSTLSWPLSSDHAFRQNISRRCSVALHNLAVMPLFCLREMGDQVFDKLRD